VIIPLYKMDNSFSVIYLTAFNARHRCPQGFLPCAGHCCCTCIHLSCQVSFVEGETVHVENTRTGVENAQFSFVLIFICFCMNGAAGGPCDSTLLMPTSYFPFCIAVLCGPKEVKAEGWHTYYLGVVF
jgi:hypothetical protein